MSRTILTGLHGTNPLGFLAALGLLRVLKEQGARVRLGFLADGSFHPFIEGIESDVAGLVARDAKLAQGNPAWSLRYEKVEKKGAKMVADLKAPPADFKRFLESCVGLWLQGNPEAAAYAAAYGTSAAVDGKGNTKPTAFHFTAANQQFLESVETLRSAVSTDWAQRSLFSGNARLPGSNLRWDPASERSWALMADKPSDDGTRMDAPTEWLAFRGLAFFPTFPRKDRVFTTGVKGRGDEMRWSWPLWSTSAAHSTIRSLLQLAWEDGPREHTERGVFAVCTSAIRRSSQGFGNFGPAAVTS